MLCVFSSVQSLSRVRLFATPWIAACQASLSITNSRSSLKLTSIESVMPSRHLILCRPLFLLPQSLPASESFSNESTLRMRWPKNWSFSFSIILSKEPPGLISFRMDWLDLLAVQGTLKSLSTSLFNTFNGTLSLPCEQGGPRFHFHQAPQIVNLVLSRPSFADGSHPVSSAWASLLLSDHISEGTVGHCTWRVCGQLKFNIFSSDLTPLNCFSPYISFFC